MGLTINDVLSRLNNVKKQGVNQWCASCPCTGHQHNDRSQSFRISTDADGRIKVYCNVGHTLQEICDALGCNTTDLLPDKPAADRKKLIDWYAKQNGLTFICEYSYCYGTYNDGLSKIRFKDASGEKTFRWIKADGSKKSGFSFSHEGCSHRLYFAGDPADDVVYLVEGEKDADTLHQLTGCTAASTEDGATKGESGLKWHDEFTQQLKGKIVFILFDNDESGRKWAKIQSDKLTGHAADVSIMDLPAVWKDCPQKADISDAVEILGAEKTVYLLKIMHENVAKQKTEEVQQTEAPDEPEDTFLKFSRDIRTTKYKPVETGMKELDDLLGGGILKQSLVILLAAPSAGKTTFSQQLLETMSESGHDALFMNLEMSREQLYARSISRIIRKQGGNLSASGVLKGYSWTPEQRKAVEQAQVYYVKNIHKRLVYNPEGMTTDIESIREVLTSAGEKAREKDPEASGPIVCLDYLHLVSSSQKMDGAEIIKQTVAVLKEYAMKYNTFVILISASNRASNASGKQTMESGRDTSSVEYSADYLLGLTYKALDEWNGRSQDKPNMEKLQQQNPRKMTLKVLKNRMSASGMKCYMDFDTASSTFTYSGKCETVKDGYTEVQINADEIFSYDDAEEL